MYSRVSSSVVFVQLNARKQKSNAAHWIRKMMLEILNRSYKSYPFKTKEEDLILLQETRKPVVLSKTALTSWR